MRILLAVSGGIDSMYLLERASDLMPGASFGIAHCNFSLRGKESDGDEDFVRKAAQEKGIPFHTVRFDTEGYSAANGISIEMAARDLRYGWFGKICSENGYDAVAVAHNADDNAETLLLNILRGCGTRGLCGMQKETVRDSLKILRPMLDIGRGEILDWMETNGRKWREDSTNAEDGHRRNILRHKVIPIMKELNPDLLNTLRREMGRWKEVDGIAERYFREKAGKVTDDGKRISTEALLGFENWKYILWRLLEKCNFSAQTFDALCTLLESGRTISGKTFETPTHIVETETGFLSVHERTQEEKAPDPMEIAGPGTIRFGNHSLVVKLLRRDALESVKAPAGTVYFDREKADFPLKLRQWRDGDRICPIGMKGSKKLSDIYGEAGLSREEKAGSIVIESSGKVICAFPLRTDKSVRIKDPDTSEVISISEL